MIIASLKPVMRWLMCQEKSGDQCQYSASLCGERRYQSHSTVFHRYEIFSYKSFSRGLGPLKYCLAANKPSIRNAVSTRSPALSNISKTGRLFPVAPSIKCDHTP